MALRNSTRLLWKVIFLFAAALVFAASWQGLGAQQSQKELWPEQRAISAHDRELTKRMLVEAHLRLKESYYDPTFHGVDVDARYQTYLQRLERSGNLGESYQIIDEYLSGIGDGHSFFVPPGDEYRYDTGFRMAVIGDQCFITGVRPGSDAEKKLHPGDQVLSVNGQALNRGNFWSVSYSLRVLGPAPVTDLELRDPEGVSRREGVLTRRKEKVRTLPICNRLGLCLTDNVYDPGEDQLRRLLRYRITAEGDLVFWKLPSLFKDETAMYGIIGQARRHKALILDLRDNPGVPDDGMRMLGQTLMPWFYPVSQDYRGEALRFMVGSLFDHDLKIGEEITRRKKRKIEAKSQGRGAFTGQLIVLVNSGTSGEAEVFARLVQLEHRGAIVGDLTAGNVMNSRCGELFLFNPDIFTESCIVDAELIMADGTSLQGVGVTPDVLVLPTSADLAAGRDPALARAAELAGAKPDPTAARKMFPMEWAPF